MNNAIMFTDDRDDGAAEALTVQPRPLDFWLRRAARRCWRGARLFMEGVGWMVLAASIIALIVK